MTLIDAFAAHRAVCNVDIPEGVSEEAFTAVLGNVCEALKALPTVERPTCKDCCLWDDTDECLGLHWCSLHNTYTPPDFYCKDGEREEDERCSTQ